MSDKWGYISFHERSPVVQLALAFLIVSAVGLALMTLLSLAGIAVFGVDFRFLDDPALSESRTEIAFLRYLLVVQQISLFIVPAIIIRSLMQPPGVSPNLDLRLPAAVDALLVVVLAFSLFSVTAFAGRLNSDLVLPAWMPGVEEWIKDKEDSIGQVLTLMMKQEGVAMLLLNILIIAVLPAVGEELIFRGVLQKLLADVLRNGSLAVLITAFIFSAVHFQFYGFLPRLILGLVFGYLYLWSGSLWLPILAHFVNNVVPTAGAYFNGWEVYSGHSDAALSNDLLALMVPLTIALVILLIIRTRNRSLNAEGDHGRGGAEI